MTLRRVGLFVLLLCAVVAVDTARAETLERVVIIERHGIRAPSKSPETLKKYAQHAWPSWSVAPGDLTPHGALNLKLLGSWMRENYALRGLLPASGCPGKDGIFVWADGKDRRTGESGDALLSGLAPGCALSSHHGEAKQIDPLFDGIASGACKLDVEEATASITRAMPGGLASPVSNYKAALQRLIEILGQANNHQSCRLGKESCLTDGENLLVVNSGTAKISGPLAKASMLTEALLLEYDEGLQPENLGWKPLTVSDLEAIAPLHNGYNALTRKDQFVARHNGAPMAQAIGKSLGGEPAFPGQGSTAARLTIIFGHDTTLENMAGFFGLDWALKNQPDNTPPGGALVFEVYRDDKGASEFLRTTLLYQTADQLRQATVLDHSSAPEQIILQPASCHEPVQASCKLGPFIHDIRMNVPESCKAQ